jgi:hypothetical protein
MLPSVTLRCDTMTGKVRAKVYLRAARPTPVRYFPSEAVLPDSIMIHSEKNARPRIWRGRLLTLGISLLFGLGAAEGIVRLVHGSPLPERTPISRVRAHPLRGWEMIPGENHYTYQHLVEVNSYGFRGPEIPEEKGPREVRILALGDSMVYGQGVADDQTLPSHLERLLNERDTDQRRWRVVNSGHRAYSTNQEVALLTELGPRLKPDIVILFWYWNDLGDVDCAAKYAELCESGPITFDTSAPMEGAALWKWKVRQLARRSALLMYLHDQLLGANEALPGAPRLESCLGVLDVHLARMVELAKKHEWRLIFAVVPRPKILVNSHDSPQLSQLVGARATAQGVEVVDLVPKLKALYSASGRLPIIPYDGHYLGEGNEAMAEAVAEVLIGE